MKSSEMGLRLIYVQAALQWDVQFFIVNQFCVIPRSVANIPED